MRFISYQLKSDPNAERFGVVTAEGVVELGGGSHNRLGADMTSMQALLRAQKIEAAMEAANSASAEHSLEDVNLLPPVTTPEKIACIGVNYFNRNEEYKDASERPKYPSVFMRTPDSVVGHDCAILRPPESDQFDYEGEITIIIGKQGRRIPEADAHSYIAGISCMNEGSVRDWLRHGKFNVTQGKNFAASGAHGP